MPGWEATFPHHTGKSKLFLDIVSVISTMTTRCPWAGAVKTIKLFAALQKEDLKTKLHKKLKICDFGGFVAFYHFGSNGKLQKNIYRTSFHSVFCPWARHCACSLLQPVRVVLLKPWIQLELGVIVRRWKAAANPFRFLIMHLKPSCWKLRPMWIPYSLHPFIVLKTISFISGGGGER